MAEIFFKTERVKERECGVRERKIEKDWEREGERDRERDR